MKKKGNEDPTLGDELLQLHNVVSGAEGGGDDEGEEQLLGALHQVLQDRLDVGVLREVTMKYCNIAIVIARGDNGRWQQRPNVLCSFVSALFPPSLGLFSPLIGTMT